MFNRLFGPPVPTLTHAELAERLKGPKPPFLVDVREPSEFQSGHMPGALMLPLGQLGDRLKELPAEQDIALVCRSGARSGSAAKQLIEAGYKALNVQGGMLAYQGPVELG